MSEITDIAIRMRQLAVQMSSTTYSQEDRDGAQEEIKSLIKAANGIAESASLGGELPLLQGPEVNHVDGSDAYIIGRLTGMLEQSEANIKAYFGLVGDGVDEVQVILTKPGAVGGVIASVGFSGRDVLTLNADYADFAAAEPNALPIKYIDRVVAHEMVHAVVANQLSTDVSTATWFNERLAELIHGADERLDALLATPSDAHAFMSTFAGGFGGSETAYAQSFVAARMLHDEMKAAGYGDGIASFLDYVKPEGRTLDDAFNRFLGMDEAGFISYVANNGGSYIIGNIDYENDDTGAIGGLDADQMGIKMPKMQLVIPSVTQNNLLKALSLTGLLLDLRPRKKPPSNCRLEATLGNVQISVSEEGPQNESALRALTWHRMPEARLRLLIKH